MVEFQILKLFCLDKTNFIRYNKTFNINYIKSNYNNIYKVYNIISIIYNKYNNTSINKEELESKYLSSYPVLKDKERSELSELVLTIFSSTADATVIGDYLEAHRERAFAGELAVASLKVSEGRDTLQSVKSLWDSYKPLTGDGVIDYVSDDLETLCEHVVGGEGTNWPWNCLRISLGPLRKGNFGFVFARPETGKTTFLAHFMTHVAKQEGSRPLLWFNNEQPGEEVKIRLYQACFGVTTQEILQRKQYYTAKYLEETRCRIKLKDEASITAREIEAICEQEQPGLVVFDQIDKIEGFSNDRYDLELGQRYQWARKLARTYCPVIGVTQADISGENTKYLTMGNVANAKTSKQAEADWILGIGATIHDDFSLYRYFNISKNKLMGDEDTLTAERHGQYRVIIEPELARYRELD